MDEQCPQTINILSDSCIICEPKQNNLFNLPNAILDYITKYYTRLEIVILSHVNKSVRIYALKHKHIKFAECKIYDSEFRINLHSNNLCVNAGDAGYLSVLIYFVQLNSISNPKLDPLIFSRAAMNNHLIILLWGTPRGYLQLNNECRICEYAALGGNIKILKWARKNKFAWSDWVPAYAALNGHFDILKWTREHDCKWDSLVCSFAAFNGHLEILQWARKNKCNWTVFTNIRAAQNGHLAVLQWAISNGCPSNLRVYTDATINGHLNILEWAVSNKFLTMANNSKNICDIAASKGHLHILKWIRETIPNDEFNNIKSSLCCNVVKSGNLNALKWALENGCELNADVCNEAIKYNHWHIVKWATKIGCDWNDSTINLILSKKIINDDYIMTFLKNAILEHKLS